MSIILRVVIPAGVENHPRNYKFIGYGNAPPDTSYTTTTATLSLDASSSGTSSTDPPSPAPPTGITPNTSAYMTRSTKTKKNKTVMSSSEKAKLWEIFDMEKNVLDNTEVTVEQPEQLNSGDIDISSNLNATFHRCTLCDHILIITEEGFPTCTNSMCGKICKEILDYSPEWRFYSSNDKNAVDTTRCGNPINPLLMESSFGCKILCDSHSSYEMKKIRKWTEWQATPHREKSLYEEFQFITIMAQNAGIPKIFIDYAMIIHKDISEQKMFRGMNRDGIKAASIYISCRLNGCPRTAHEIADIFKLDKQSTTYGCSMAVNILNNIERNMDPSQKTELGTTTPSAFIDRYCSRLNIMNELAILAKFIAQKVENKSIVCDNTPQSTAAGIVYFVSQMCKLGINKTDIKGICGVSEVTINKCYKKLFSIREQLIPQSILQKYSCQ
jgi:transcription initiation factor TFIIB